MARNFLPVPYAPYNGTLSGRPFSGNAANTMVSAQVKWFTYNIAGQPLGTANPECNITVDLNNAASNVVKQQWLVRSLYIDNLGVNFPVFVYFPSTGFSVVCPPNSSGWYQTQTADRRAWIVALDISDIDVANQATTNVFFTDAIVNSDLDQEAPTAVAMGLSSPLISLGASGGQLVGVNILTPGQWTNSQALSVMGGGGVGASAHGSRNIYGQFASVTVDTPGNSYSGTPIITYTGGFGLPPGWTSIGVYAAGALVQYIDGMTYGAQFANQGVVPPGNPNVWAPLGLTAVGIAPTFQAVISPAAGGASFSNAGLYGPEALGDQVRGYNDSLNNVGVFRPNLLGSPYASGFIYLTHINVRVLNRSANATWTWQLEDTDGNIILPFDYNAGAGQLAVETILDLQKCNIKLPANRTYQLRTTAFNGTIKLQHFFTWGYSEAFG